MTTELSVADRILDDSAEHEVADSLDLANNLGFNHQKIAKVSNGLEVFQCVSI